MNPAIKEIKVTVQNKKGPPKCNMGPLLNVVTKIDKKSGNPLQHQIHWNPRLTPLSNHKAV